jgi:hypothetical protein
MTSKFELTRRGVLRGLGGLALTAVACKPEDGGAIDDPPTGSITSAQTVMSIIPVRCEPRAAPFDCPTIACPGVRTEQRGRW